MTVAVQALPITYNGNGTASPLAVPFRFLANDHLVVTRIDAAGARTVLLRGTDYTVSGADTGSGGSVTPLAAIAVGDKWEIDRFTPREQPTAYPPGDDFPAATHEKALDRTMLVAQEIDKVAAALATRTPLALPGQTAPAFDVTGLAEDDLLVFKGGQIKRFDAAPFAGKFYSGGADGRPVPSAGLGGGDLALRTDLASSIGSMLVRFLFNALGAVSRPLRDKLMDTCCVLDFGAVGDDATDCTAAIQAALDAGRGNVYVPKGVYRITAPLRMPWYTRLYGVGEPSKIKTLLDIEMIVNDDPGIIVDPVLKDICLENAFPVSDVVHTTITATTTAGSPVISVPSVEGLTKAMRVSGPGIPDNCGIRRVSRTGGLNFELCDMTYDAPLRNAEATGTVTLTLSYRRGQTKFNVHFHNPLRPQLKNVKVNSVFIDTDYSPENHAGFWLSRDAGSSYFIAEIDGCFLNKGQILCAISDSNIKNTIVWSNPFDFSIALEAPGCTVVGCNTSGGLIAAIRTRSTDIEPNGGLNHTIVANNIDGGGIWYTGDGVLMLKPVNNTVSGNRINYCQKAALRIVDGVNCALGNNGYLRNNEDDAGYSDIEIVGVEFGTNRALVNGSSFFNVSRTQPGRAIREVDGGATPILNAYSNNAVSSNYLEPSFLILQPFTCENSGNVGSVTNGVTVFTPTWTNITVGNGTSTGWYKRHGNEITFYARLDFGSTTAVTDQLALITPIVAARASLGSAAAYDSDTTVQYTSAARIAAGLGLVFVYSDGVTPGFWNATNPFTWATGDVLEIQITFPV